MKKIALILVLFVALTKAIGQTTNYNVKIDTDPYKPGIPAYKPLPMTQPAPVVINEFNPYLIPEQSNNNNSNNSNANKSKNVDFENTTINLYKLRHLIVRNDTSFLDSTSSKSRQFIIRTNYIIDVTNNFVWDIKKKEYDSKSDMMIFNCTRDNQYFSNFGIKMDGSIIVMFWNDARKRTEYYMFY
jgi:hypothetical protein